MQKNKFLKLAKCILPVFFLFVFFNAFGQSTKEKAEKALEKGVLFLQAKGDTLLPRTILLAHFLERKFDKPKLKPLEGFVDRIEPVGSMNVMARLLHGRVMISGPEAILEMESAVDKVAAKALYCDVWPNPNILLEILQLPMDKDYGVSTALWSLLFLVDNGCYKRKDPNIVSIEQMVAETMFNNLTKTEFMTVGHNQQLGMLYHAGYDKKIEEKWIQRILDQQRSDGGWQSGISSRHSNDLATIYAIWVLLEYLYPEVPDISWIPGKK